MLPVFKGTLKKKEDRWFVFTKSSVDKEGWPMFITKQNIDSELEIFPTDNFPIEWLEKHINQEVDYVMSKKFLAKETLWHGKIIKVDKQESWESIIERYGRPVGVPEDALEFWNWLRENYHPPKKI
jgi:hypothetical protein